MATSSARLPRSAKDKAEAILSCSYDEYGIPAVANAGRFQYTGQAWIPELRMYHYKARIYSPGLGRFLQTDPVGYQDQFNLYAYVGNDPVNGTDPTGAIRKCPVNDDQCIETESSAREPGDPPPPSPEEEEMQEVVIIGERQNRADFSHENEEFFLVVDGQMRPRPMTRERVNCGTYREPEYVHVGHPGAIPRGQMII